MELISIVTKWWLIIFLFGVIGYPISWKIFSNFKTRGYTFSKIFSILVVSYVVFIVTLLKISRYSLSTILVTLALYGFVNLYFFWRQRDRIIHSIRKQALYILFQELLFLGGLVFWSWIRGFQPDIVGLEKYMDLGFINSLLRTDYLPPVDMWFSGEYINYYWFGHYITSLLTKLSSLPSVVTYNLMLATILGFTLSGTFSIVSSLVRTITKKNKAIFVGGMLSAILLTFGGNLHNAFYHIRLEACEQQLITCTDKTTKEYWYPDATRFVGYDPETNDKTIHEFPLYSFVVSDLHAHLINLPFVLLFVAMLSEYILQKRSKHKEYILLFLGFSIGCFFITNAWDTANYLLLTGFAFGFTELYSKLKDNKIHIAFIKTVVPTIKRLIIVCSTAYLTAYPFLVNFTSIAQGVDLVNARTPLWQLAILWGIPLFMIIIFSYTIKYLTLKKLERSDIVVFSLLAASLILIIIPEIIYVKDIYISSHHRANTMFKLTYQAFVLGYLSSGYVTIRLLQLIKSKYIITLVLLFFGLLYSSVLQYPKLAIDSYYSDLKRYKGVSGDTWIQEHYPSEKDVIDWFNTSVPGQPVILEAPGDSYSDYNLISAYTGLPTVTGWFVHEWLWRGEASIPQSRLVDVKTIYTSSDRKQVASLLKKYNISYIIVGVLEKQKYPNINNSFIESLGQPVFRSEETVVYKVSYPDQGNL